MGQKYKRFRKSRMPFPLRVLHKNPRSMYARVPQAIAQFVLKIEKLSHIMGPTPILEMAEMAGAYGLRPRLWFLVMYISGVRFEEHCSNISGDILNSVFYRFSGTIYDVITFLICMIQKREYL